MSAREKAIAAAKKRTEAAEKQTESQTAEPKKKSGSKPDPKAAAMAGSQKTGRGQSGGSKLKQQHI